MDSLNDEPESLLALLVHEQYSSLHFQLPPKQYTILAGFVLTCSSSRKHKVISIATGSKCLPATRLSPLGDSLNDSHAEVLARRGALRWFLEEVQRVHSAQPSHESQWIALLHNGRYRLRDCVKLHMYISTLPCGDASTRFIAHYQDEETALFKDSISFPVQPADKPWRGRNNYHCYGVLRTKPGRADSPSTLSMSCSDKIASWNVLGLQGSLGAHLFMPLYPSSIIIGDVEEYMRDMIMQDCERALWRRVADVADLPDGYVINHPEIRFTSLQFVHSRTSLSKLSLLSGSCNDSLCWIADSVRKHEVLINGLKRGVPPKHRHNPKYLPTLSKLALYQALDPIFHASPELLDDQIGTYYRIKQMAKDYQRAKKALLERPPFTAWIRNGIEWQSFDLNGNIRGIQTKLHNNTTSHD